MDIAYSFLLLFLYIGWEMLDFYLSWKTHGFCLDLIDNVIPRHVTVAMIHGAGGAVFGGLSLIVYRPTILTGDLWRLLAVAAIAFTNGVVLARLDAFAPRESPQQRNAFYNGVAFALSAGIVRLIFAN